MTTLIDIQKFLEPGKFAIAGVSRNPRKFGSAVYKELKKKGFELYPVNPNADEVQESKCFRSLADLPEDVKHLYIVTPSKSTTDLAKQAVDRGFDMIWIQQKSETKEAIRAIQDAGIPLIYKKCLMMFADPVNGIHGFHRFLSKLFGGYPKMETPSAN